MAMSLHGHMRIEVIQGPVGLFAAIPPTLIHALDLLISPPRPLVLLGTRDGDKRVYLPREP